MLKLLKSNLLIFAMVFAIGSAFAFTAENKSKTTEKWANDSGTWVPVQGQTQQPPAGGPGDYRCTLVEEPPICTAEFPQGMDPNLDPTGQTDEIYGNYIEL